MYRILTNYSLLFVNSILTFILTAILGQVTKLNHFQIHICFYHENSTFMLNGD